MKISTDFAGIMRSMAIEKKTGVLSVDGPDWSSVVWLIEGQILRATLHTETGWALGEALVQARILPRAQAMRALVLARKSDVESEEILTGNGWVALTVVKRFRERLNMATLTELGARSGYRVEFKAAAPAPQQPWDSMIPVSYALREVSRRLERLEGKQSVLPAPEDRFEMTEGIESDLFSQQDQTYGGPEEEGRSLRLSEDEKRVLFFCNGDVDFRNLPIISGVAQETAGEIIVRLSSARLIRPATGPPRDTSWARDRSPLIRYGVAFVQGLVATVLTFLFLAQASNLLQAGRGYPPPIAEQEFYRLGDHAVVFEVQSALVQYHFEWGHYPKDLSRLTRNALLSSNTMSSPLLSGELIYTIGADAQSYRLSLTRGTSEAEDFVRFGGDALGEGTR